MTAPSSPQAGIWYWLGLLLCAGVLVLALIPGGGPPLFPGFDKVMHAGVFACLGGWFGALAAGRAQVLTVAIGLACFGALIEVLQGWTGREPSARDLLADIAGIALGLWLLRSVMAFVLGYIEDRVQPARD